MPPPRFRCWGQWAPHPSLSLRRYRALGKKLFGFTRYRRAKARGGWRPRKCSRLPFRVLPANVIRPRPGLFDAVFDKSGRNEDTEAAGSARTQIPLRHAKPQARPAIGRSPSRRNFPTVSPWQSWPGGLPRKSRALARVQYPGSLRCPEHRRRPTFSILGYSRP